MHSWLLLSLCAGMAQPSSAAAPARQLTVVLPGGATMEMVWIPPGSFLMGTPDGEQGREPNEGPRHRVTLSRGFWLGKYEVTQHQWERVMGTRPWEGEVYVGADPNCPAVYLSWDDATALAERVSAADSSAHYRLPTEAEWEYACRAGTDTPYSFGADVSRLGDYAWHGKNTFDVQESYAHPVGRKRANPWGLHDMHGNVWEWVQDWYGPYSAQPQVDPTGPTTGTDRVFRGGSFFYLASFARSGYRGFNQPRHRLFNLGMRLVREEGPRSTRRVSPPPAPVARPSATPAQASTRMDVSADAPSVSSGETHPTATPWWQQPRLALAYGAVAAEPVDGFRLLRLAGIAALVGGIKDEAAMARAAAQGIRLIGLGYAWGIPHSIPSCRQAVNEEGRISTAACPFSDRFWEKTIREPVLETARRSLRFPNVAGFFVDSEQYAVVPNTRVCFCDDCWEHFLAWKGVAAAHVPPSGRAGWLREKGLFSVPGGYLEWVADRLAAQYRTLAN
ncbi:MAG: formylglycine-generating enzyme family protein, partial [Armatimonadota bacterium]|nr:formylglycine-generating enzyme family protein [Armatimonadota bacterium]